MNADTARAIMPTGYGSEPYRTLTNDERYRQWAKFYFGHGHHRARNDSTARKPQGGATDASQQSGLDQQHVTLPDLSPVMSNPRRAGFADTAQTETYEDYARGEVETGRWCEVHGHD